MLRLLTALGIGATYCVSQHPAAADTVALQAGAGLSAGTLENQIRTQVTESDGQADVLSRITWPNGSPRLDAMAAYDWSALLPLRLTLRLGTNISQPIGSMTDEDELTVRDERLSSFTASDVEARQLMLDAQVAVALGATLRAGPLLLIGYLHEHQTLDAYGARGRVVQSVGGATETTLTNVDPATRVMGAKTALAMPYVGLAWAHSPTPSLEIPIALQVHALIVDHADRHFVRDKTGSASGWGGGATLRVAPAVRIARWEHASLGVGGAFEATYAATWRGSLEQRYENDPLLAPLPDAGFQLKWLQLSTSIFVRYAHEWTPTAH